MKTNQPFRLPLLALLALVMVLHACSKERSVATDPLTEEQAISYSDESAQAESSFDDAEDLSLLAADDDDLAVTGRGYHPTFEELRLRLGPCATITVTPNDSTYPKTITVDFGDGCLCADGKYRKGAVITHLTGPIRRTGSVMTITFQNYYINRAHIQGTKIVTNQSTNGNLVFGVRVVNGSVTYPSGRGWEYQVERLVRQVQGGGTRMIRDDVFEMTGRSNTAYNSGVRVTLNTESPLIKKVVCPWVSDGDLKIRINDRILFLDFGAPDNGSCDNKALLTWNNGANQRLITLP